MTGGEGQTGNFQSLGINTHAMTPVLRYHFKVIALYLILKIIYHVTYWIKFITILEDKADVSHKIFKIFIVVL